VSSKVCHFGIYVVS